MNDQTTAAPQSTSPAPSAERVVHHHYHPAPNHNTGSTAVLLEVIPGLFQIFGIGHIYSGRVGIGLLFMFGYWAVAFVNFLLCFIFIGFFTWPVCWIATMIVSPIIAHNNIKSKPG